MRNIFAFIALTAAAFTSSANARVEQNSYMDPQKFAYFDSSISSGFAEKSTLETLLSRKSVVREAPAAFAAPIMQRAPASRPAPALYYYNNIQTNSGW